MTPSPPPSRDRALRSDARRNRRALLETAQRLFRERGIDVPLEEVASAAGVSIGTLYNRFPSRADLVAAVFVDHLRSGVEIIEDALTVDDPWEAFVKFVTGIAERQARDRGFSDVLARGMQANPDVKELQARGYAGMQQLITSAQAAGALREDFTPEDLAFVAWGVGRTLEATSDIAPEAWRRHLGLLLDGMRVGAPHALSSPALSYDELQRAMRAQR